MSTRDVRELIIERWEAKLKDAGVKPARVHALALELAVICEAHGVRLQRPAHYQDPVATDWARSPEEKLAQAGDHAAGLQAARSAIVRNPQPGPTA